MCFRKKVITLNVKGFFLTHNKFYKFFYLSKGLTGTHSIYLFSKLIGKLVQLVQIFSVVQGLVILAPACLCSYSLRDQAKTRKNKMNLKFQMLLIKFVSLAGIGILLKLCNLEELDLQGNFLESSILLSLNKFSNLKILNLASNELNGSISINGKLKIHTTVQFCQTKIKPKERKKSLFFS